MRNIFDALVKTRSMVKVGALFPASETAYHAPPSHNLHVNPQAQAEAAVRLWLVCSFLNCGVFSICPASPLLVMITAE